MYKKPSLGGPADEGLELESRWRLATNLYFIMQNMSGVLMKDKATLELKMSVTGEAASKPSLSERLTYRALPATSCNAKYSFASWIAE